jgi:hypothetical protein
MLTSFLTEEDGKIEEGEAENIFTSLYHHTQPHLTMSNTFAPSTFPGK